MGRQIVAQLSPGDMLGRIKGVVAVQPDGAEIILGTVLGEVRALSYRHNPQDETKPSIALVGPFKFIPADETRDELWGMRCFLPGAIHESIVASLEGDNKRPYTKSPGRKEPSIDVALGGVMRVVLEIGVRKTSTAIGYEYITRTSDKVPLEMNDPLAELSKAAGVKSLAGPIGTRAELPAPDFSEAEDTRAPVRRMKRSKR